MEWNGKIVIIRKKRVGISNVNVERAHNKNCGGEKVPTSQTRAKEVITDRNGETKVRKKERVR